MGHFLVLLFYCDLARGIFLLKTKKAGKLKEDNDHFRLGSNARPPSSLPLELLTPLTDRVLHLIFPARLGRLQQRAPQHQLHEEDYGRQHHRRRDHHERRQRVLDSHRLELPCAHAR